MACQPCGTCVREPVAGRAGFDDLAGDGEPVDDGGAGPWVGECLGPAAERLVGSVVSSWNAVSSTFLVNCLSNPSGPVRDKPCSFASRTSSLAASASADGTDPFLAGTSPSVTVITAPLPLTRSAGRAGNTVRSTVPASSNRHNRPGVSADGAKSDRHTAGDAMLGRGPDQTAPPG